MLPRSPLDWPSPSDTGATVFRTEDVLTAFVHESRNAVFGISATLEAFQVDFGGSALGAEYSEMMTQPLARLRVLTDQLADYARPAALEPRSVLPMHVAASAVDSVAGLAKSRGVELRLSGASLSPAMLDAERLGVALATLLECAILRSKAAVDLQVDERVADGQRSLRFSVCDNGKSLEACQGFEPAFAQQGKGTVWNLAKAQRIALQHGGEITAQNSPAGGVVLSLIVRGIGGNL